MRRLYIIRSIIIENNRLEELHKTKGEGTRSCAILYSTYSAYYFNNQFDKALEVFQDALLKWPDNELIYVYGGDIYKKMDDYDKAFFYWNKSLSISDDSADAMYSKVFCYQELGDKENESKMWKQIIEWLEKRGLIVEAEWPKKNTARY